MALWKQAAVVKPILPSRRRWPVPEAEELPEREEHREEPREVEPERELSSKEVSIYSEHPSNVLISMQNPLATH